MLTNDEKKRMTKFIDIYNAENPPKGTGLMALIAFGPSCWNGGLHSYEKYQNGKKCWCCDGYHDA